VLQCVARETRLYTRHEDIANSLFVCCIPLQSVAECYSVLQCVCCERDSTRATKVLLIWRKPSLCVAVCCSV